MNIVVMTVKGRLDLTRQCLVGLAKTAKQVIDKVVIVDAAMFPSSDFVDAAYARLWYGGDVIVITSTGCNIPEGWNTGISYARDFVKVGAGDEKLIWLLNNDVEFIASGWLEKMEQRLREPGTGMVGTGAMSVFGLPFVTGGVWGFRLKVADEVSETSEVLDNRLHFCCQDVDLSVRIAKAGYVVTHVPGIEWGEAPMLVHMISQTMLADHTEKQLYELREPERKILIDKHGRRDGRSGYDGVVEGT